MARSPGAAVGPLIVCPWFVRGIEPRDAAEDATDRHGTALRMAGADGHERRISAGRSNAYNADSVRMTTALDAPCTARRTSSSGSCSVPEQGRGGGEFLGEG